jgi:hypothetical protein
MREWAYRATTARVGKFDTVSLANNERFLCRSAFSEGGAALIANVQHVDFGNALHVYYKDAQGYTAVGAFEIVNSHEDDRRFAALVKRTALQIVTDQDLERKLLGMGGPTQEGYRPDPLIGRFTGWLLKPLEVPTRSFPAYLFPEGFQGGLREF